MSITAQDVATTVGAAGADTDGVMLYLYSKNNSPFPAAWYRLDGKVDGSHALMAATAAVQSGHSANISMVNGKVTLLVCNAG